MCGITGISYNNAIKIPYDIKKMSDEIAHRGPDGEGYIAIQTEKGIVTELAGKKTPINAIPIESYGTGADVYMAHRRLSIIDLTKAGHQPMASNSKNVWLTFNGELYNYKTLRTELESAGYSFSSQTDTEVLLHAYEKWGVHCLQKFNGMWAFVLYDKTKNILFGARDRFGVKPLYYSTQSDFFAFNSEIKGLLAIPELSRKINTNASFAYLRSGEESFDGETFFENIRELPHAHYFIFDIKKRKLEIKKYFSLQYNDTWESFDDKKAREYTERVREKVINAVKLRLNADVTVGSCLSGGVDSSAIVCVINELLKKESISSVGAKQAVVTACYNNSKIDESKWAKIVSDAVQADWHRVYPERDELFTDLEDLIYSQDIPFGSTSIYAQYRVMKTAKEHGITVMLDGQGGDELFTGYEKYYKMFYDEARKNKDFDLLKAEENHIRNTPFNSNAIFGTSGTAKIKRLVKKCIPDIMITSIRKMRSPDPAYICKNFKAYTNHPYTTLNQMLAVLMQHTSLQKLLKYEDRNSMRFSIESRTPFADDIDLIEYVFSIPGVYKIHNGWSKFLLRDSMKGIVPDAITTRTDKIGFSTPEYEWLKTIKPLVFENLNPIVTSFIDTKKLQSEWDIFFETQQVKDSSYIWRFINFILWAKKYEVV